MAVVPSKTRPARVVAFMYLGDDMKETERASWGKLAAIGVGIACVVAVLHAFLPGWSYITETLCKPDGPAWVQAIGSIVAIFAAVGVAYWQGKIARARDERAEYQASTKERNIAVHLLNVFCGAVFAVEGKFKPDKAFSAWDVRLMRVVLVAELQNALSLPVTALSPESQKAFWGFRLIAYQLIEALQFAERSIVKGPEGDLVVNTDAKQFLLDLIKEVHPRAIEFKDVLENSGL